MKKKNSKQGGKEYGVIVSLESPRGSGMTVSSLAQFYLDYIDYLETQKKGVPVKYLDLELDTNETHRRFQKTMGNKFMLEISEQDYKEAGSKFVDTGITTYTENDIGKSFYFPIEMKDLDWDELNKSMKIDTVVTEGVNKGHAEKISFGVDQKGIWKGKSLYKNISGKDMPMAQGKDGKLHPTPDTDDIIGKKGVGVWVVTKGIKGGDPTKGSTVYPKLQDIQPAGFKPGSQGTGKDLGI